MAELFAKVNDIQRKAEESEAMVQEICRDIRKLDYAKTHLTAAITSLRRLAMVTAAMTELEQVAYKCVHSSACAILHHRLVHVNWLYSCCDAVLSRYGSPAARGQCIVVCKLAGIGHGQVGKHACGSAYRA
jgi:hypothetical protein